METMRQAASLRFIRPPTPGMSSSRTRNNGPGIISGVQMVRPSGFCVAQAILARCRLAAKPMEQVIAAPML